MRKLLAMAAIIVGCTATVATAQVQVRGHFRKDGTYVQPHVRSAPNSTTLDNYSTRGNVNPYTGREGTVDPYRDNNPYRSYSPPPRSNPYEVQRRETPPCSVYTPLDC